MKLRSIEQIKGIKDKRFLVRVDFNVPLRSGKVIEDIKIERSLATIKFLIKRGGKVVLISHLGRPGGKVNRKYSLRPVAKHLSKLLKKKVIFNISKIPSAKLEKQIRALGSGRVMLFENTRFYAGEKKNSPVWSRQLARGFDYFINDAFAACHRAHASVSGAAKFLPSYAGFNLIEEVDNLSQVFHSKKPLILIIGGAKISTKVKVIKKFLPLAKKILLGGGLVNNILLAAGYKVGSSLIDKDGLAGVGRLRKYFDKKIVLPPDLVIGNVGTGKKIEIVNVEKCGRIICKRGEAVYDMGPKSVALYKKFLKGAGTIVWNGPLGYVEKPAF
ncbi:phosphoglycerate kinase, partial [Patescibacteria group bacterium]|nr:phosphoglycerate kinase [Patescibacteria group bacterium]MBU1922347.1 phosphoglycerate kinase [Patescibacteria group bacterium]